VKTGIRSLQYAGQSPVQCTFIKIKYHNQRINQIFFGDWLGQWKLPVPYLLVGIASDESLAADDKPLNLGYNTRARRARFS